ncbi:MAG: Asp-tRNA(Asn)/Glu-tRNA(Gln) amidotransferase subunit GatC [Candidatus Kerfeldbacteria bacterium]|nr:Asp-tRNA(Asn)/Glu-tRNA(Gln) amidotransferase subunit GatC [Candidatus Kerfeldbacteria bacterium]
MALTEQDIQRLAHLARIELTPEEAQVFGEQLSSVLEYAKQIEEVDTSSVQLSSHIDYLTDVFRADIPVDASLADESIAQFPQAAGRLNKVKAVME